MISKKLVIGIYFGIDNLVLTEIENKSLIGYYSTRYALSSEEKAVSFEEVDQIKLADILQEALRERQIETKNAVVSLPIRNVILRSFFMPMMPAEELDAAIEFEAKKYIPFKLEELTYDYQLFKIKEETTRKLRILLVGVKNELVEKYKFALEQSDLKIQYVEPSAVSLLRVLIFKAKLSPKEAAAIVEVNSKGGNIIISDNGIPTFINDFRFTLTPDERPVPSDVLLAKLANDIRLSIEYYHRHSPKSQINSIILCPEEIQPEVIDGLKREMEIPVISIGTEEVLGLEEQAKIDLLYAYGAGIRDAVPSAITIDLFKKMVAVPEGKLIGLRLEKLTSQQVKKLIQTGVIAVALVFILFLFNFRRISNLQTQLKNIEEKRLELKAELRSLSKSELESKLSNIKQKLQIFSGIKKEKALAPLLDVLPQLLPEGIWLKSLSFNAQIETNISQLNISGACYTEDRSIQINIINQFISNLKKNPLFSKKFTLVDITSMTQQEIDNWLVTNFEVICK